MDGVRNLLAMAQRFTWSDLQSRDPLTGSLTMAGWIGRIQPLMWRLNFCDWATHFLYFVLRGVAGSGKPFFYNTWSPLDSDDVTSYILVITIQVHVTLLHPQCPHTATAIFWDVGSHTD
jgi:hypothetical protein